MSQSRTSPLPALLEGSSVKASCKTLVTIGSYAGCSLSIKSSFSESNSSLFNRSSISDGDAVSKNSSTASTKLSLASSIVLPWLAISNSGQSTTYESRTYALTQW